MLLDMGPTGSSEHAAARAAIHQAIKVLTTQLKAMEGGASSGSRRNSIEQEASATKKQRGRCSTGDVTGESKIKFSLDKADKFEQLHSIKPTPNRTSSRAAPWMLPPGAQCAMGRP